MKPKYMGRPMVAVEPDVVRGDIYCGPDMGDEDISRVIAERMKRLAADLPQYPKMKLAEFVSADLPEVAAPAVTEYEWRLIRLALRFTADTLLESSPQSV